MKWSEEKVELLKSLALAGASNAEIARQLNAGISDVYAKRSQLGITIDKVRAMKSSKTTAVNPEFEKAVQGMDSKMAVTRELDAKCEFLKALEPVLKMADSSIRQLSLANQGKTVLIDCGDHGTNVNIEGDSLLAIIADVTRKCLF